MQACTIIAKNYVPFARVLARSFRAHHPDSPFTVFVIDDWRGYIDPAQEPFEVLGPDDLVMPAFDAMSRRYDVLELATAVKPWVMRHLMSRTEDGATLYLDPDIKVFNSLQELETLARAAGVVLIPHLTEAIPRDGRRPSEIDILAAGAYNLGFLGLARQEETDRFLDWWAERLETDCRNDPTRSLFVDQRWIDLVPGMIDAAIVRDPGYDVAYWNLHYRKITSSSNGYLVNGSPLRFFHFSGYDPASPGRLSKHQNRLALRGRPTLSELCADYRLELLDAGYREHRTWPYEPWHLRRESLTRPVPGGRAATDPGAWRPEISALRTLPPSIPVNHPQAPRRRSLGQRIVDLEKLIEGTRRSGAGRFEIVRDVLREVNPLPERPSAARAHVVSTDCSPAADAQGVNVFGYLNSEVGVGEVSRQTVSALRASKIPVVAVSEIAAAYHNEQLHRADPLSEARHAINLICVNADMLPDLRRRIGEGFFRDRFTIGFWNWEVHAFPERFAAAFELVDEVWVCSQHTADALRGCSDTPVIHVRIPVVPEAPVGRLAADPRLPDGFTFLFMFDYLSVFERKNPLGLITAFTEAFAPRSGASLLIKCINAEQRPDAHELLIADADRHPDVHVIAGYLSTQEKNAMIAQCGCYVSLHRAEGFGLTMAEAMYFGRPVIATGYSGNLEFMNTENSYLIDHAMVPIGCGNDPYPAHGEWAEPDLDQAARIMREVFMNRLRRNEKGARGAADIRRTHSREAAGADMGERLDVIRAEQGAGG